MSNPSLAGRYPMPWGYVEVVSNEISIVSTVEDPPKVRMGATAGGSLGCLSFNRVRADGVQDEVALCQGKIDERYRSIAEGGHADHTELVGEFRFDVRKPQVPGESDDRTMVPVLRLLHDRIIAYRPVVDPNGTPLASSGSTGRVTRFYTDGGRACVNVQDDQFPIIRLVKYQIVDPNDESTWIALGETRI